MDAIIQELYNDVIRRMKPGVDTPVLTALLEDNFFRKMISENYKLLNDEGTLKMYRKEEDKWIEIKGFKTGI